MVYRFLIQRVSLRYAVFDLHFHTEDPTIFAIAGSTGSVALFRVVVPDPDSPSAPDPEIKHLWTIPVHDEDDYAPRPALFLSWAPRNWLPDSSDGFAVTFPNGRTSIYGTGSDDDIAQSGATITKLDDYYAREQIEVWFVAVAMYHEATIEAASPMHARFVFTGDDFGSLHTRRLADTKDLVEQEGSDAPDEPCLPPMLLDYDDRARHHTAGVTSILPLPLELIDDAPLLLTGSYDEYLRVYHATRRGAVLSEVCLGGGVWRLQLLRTDRPVERAEWSFLILASCMHAGTRLVRVILRQQDGDTDEWEMSVLAEFTEHESMNYASDVWRGDCKDDSLLCVSSSFYDKRVCLWKAEWRAEKPA